MKAIALALVVAGCSFDPVAIHSDLDGAPADGGGGGYRKRLTFPANGRTTDLAGFPAAIFVDDGDLAGKVRDDGFDLHFTTGDGATRLPHEIEELDAMAGRLVAWVRVPLLPAGMSTDLWLEYGGTPDTTDPQDVAATWAGTVRAVWHLSEDPRGTAPQFRDSASGYPVGQMDAMKTPATDRGIAGRALDYDGLDDSTSGPDPGGLDFGLGSFSYSLWVNVTTPNGGFDVPWHKGGTAADENGYDFELGSGTWNGGLSGGPAAFLVSFGLADPYFGRWVSLVMVIDRENDEARAYAEGMKKITVPIAGVASFDNDNAISIGYATYPFQGRIDEVRVYPTALSEDWITAEHQNLTDPGAFVVVGPGEMR